MISTLLLLAQVQAAPFSQTPRGQALYERVMTPDRVREVLERVPPEQLALLDQLMFLADLRSAAGNEDQPLRILRRVQTELAEPVAVSPASVELVLQDMERVMEAHEGAKGYDVVTEMLASAQGAFPSTGTCLERIASQPGPIAAAFLVREFFADDHYHPWVIRHGIFEILATGDYGPLPLRVYEDLLHETYPNDNPDGDYQVAIRAARPVVGADFDDWYLEVRGSSYLWESFKARWF